MGSLLQLPKAPVLSLPIPPAPIFGDITLQQSSRPGPKSPGRAPRFLTGVDSLQAFRRGGCWPQGDKQWAWLGETLPGPHCSWAGDLQRPQDTACQGHLCVQAPRGASQLMVDKLALPCWGDGCPEGSVRRVFHVCWPGRRGSPQHHPSWSCLESPSAHCLFGDWQGPAGPPPQAQPVGGRSGRSPGAGQHEHGQGPSQPFLDPDSPRVFVCEGPRPQECQVPSS